jgi:nitroreductase
VTGQADHSLPAVLGQAEEAPAQRAVFEALATARSMRYVRPDPVPPDYIEAIVWAATRAASADNCQPWEFIAVTDRDQIRRLAAAVAPFREMVAGLPPPADESEARTLRGARFLFDHLADVPLLLFVCGRSDVVVGMQPERYMWLAVAGAAQNALVAARALGLGAAYTMFHLGDQAAVHEILGLPEEVRLAVLLTMGWPARSFGPMTRRPVGEVLRYDHW